MLYYFVSYVFSGSKNSRGGFGCCEVPRSKPITHLRDLEEIVNDFEKEMPDLGDFTVINFQLLRKEDAAE